MLSMLSRCVSSYCIRMLYTVIEALNILLALEYYSPLRTQINSNYLSKRERGGNTAHRSDTCRESQSLVSLRGSVALGRKIKVSWVRKSCWGSCPIGGFLGDPEDILHLSFLIANVHERHSRGTTRTRALERLGALGERWSPGRCEGMALQRGWQRTPVPSGQRGSDWPLRAVTSNAWVNHKVKQCIRSLLTHIFSPLEWLMGNRI